MANNNILNVEQENNIAASGEKLTRAITNGEFVLAVTFVRNGEEQAHGEYDDVTAEIESRSGIEVVSLRGSMESLNAIWQMLELFGQELSDSVESGVTDDDILPMFGMRMYPVEQIPDLSYAEMAFPQLWAFSADGYGQSADHLRIAFLSDLCGIYLDEAE